MIGSIGAGNCDLEVELAHAVQQAGLKNAEFHCFDVNQHMLSRGEALARDKGVADSMHFMQTDIQSWNPAQAYSVCIANQALHHFIDLELLFSKIKKAIHPDGVFLTSDMIGRNGHMRWPEALEIINSLWEKMPDKYKFNHQLNRLEMHYDNWDCSQESFEGIRSQDILPLLIKNFHFEVFFAFNNIINIFIDRGFGHNFDVQNAEDTAFIDSVARLDEEKIAQGVVKPTQILAAMRTADMPSPRYFKNITPEFCLRIP